MGGGGRRPPRRNSGGFNNSGFNNSGFGNVGMRWQWGGGGSQRTSNTGEDVVWINIANLPDTVLTGDLQVFCQFLIILTRDWGSILLRNFRPSVAKILN